MKKINTNLVIDFEDIIGGGDCPTYNNMDFYLSNEKRLRFKLNELDDECFEGNIFYKCFHEKTLEILKQQNVKFAFNVESREISSDDIFSSRYHLPRFDCNEFKYGQAS